MRPLVLPYYTDDVPRRVVPPVQILRDAAAQLEDRTGGAVRGSVFTLNPGGTELFRHTFYLLVPDLDEYTHPLFYAWHDAEFYPVQVMLPGQSQRDAEKSQNEEGFQSKVEQIFRSQGTRSLIQALIAQVGDGRTRS